MLIAILSAFLGGLILNCMPCVFPIISLKAFGLLRQGGDQAHLRREGVAFLVGSLLAMLALAGVLMALRAGGEAVGWGFQLQSPAIVALLALVMIGSALNLMGLFEMGIGLQRAGQAMDGRSGLIGTALTGALSVMVATPCAGPFMAGALGYALVQPPLVGLAVFAALAVGVAAPFTLLCFCPPLARMLPRPGAWMVTLKHGLAFPMLAAAAWLIWVLDAQTGSAGLPFILGCALLLAMTAWLYGLAQRRAMSGKPARALTLAAATGLAAIGAAFAMPGQAFETRRPVAQADSGPIRWSPARVARETAAGRPVFVDFSASWCLTCKVNEKAVLSTPAFKEAMARTNTAFMIADSTNYDAEIEKAMSDLGRTGLPLYLVYPAGGGKPVILPQVLSIGMATGALDVAAGGKG
ncbi:protein-disulfide reductase DsbD family protein [Novosphingobium sediminicola]|uniref:Thiol:disulfide interchange protein DsbD n=1 Tax=Novosphingobium sediminicola TaxID=563162 RepID=A0A7W6CHJ3_9SPHN|nr:thioredoxin family protein [Novosphingobium sediminicola]MBB3956671.1 thiol:disulfide interchange protein DsbD [Novosphingobium sediminicola]